MEILSISSILTARQFEYFEFQPYCANATNWVASDLPEGVKIDPATGRIYGAVMNLGVYMVMVVASDGAGGEAQRLFTIGISDEVAPPINAVPPADAIRVIVNLDTCEVVMPDSKATADKDTVPTAFALKSGDKRLLAVYFQREEQPVRLTLESLVFGLKEFAGDSVILQTSKFQWLVDYYLVLVDLSEPDVARVLNDYEKDYEQGFDALGELQWVVKTNFNGEDKSLLTSTRTFRVRVDKDLIPDSATQ